MPTGIHSVHAFCLAANVRPAELLAQLALGPVRRLSKNSATVQVDAGSMVAFDFGAFVFFDVDEARRAEVAKQVLTLVAPEPHAPLADDYAVVVDADRPLSVAFDRATIPRFDDLSAEIIAVVLGQSVSLDYFDEDVSALSRRVALLTSELAEHGRLRASTRAAHRTVGTILVTRSQIVESLSLLDAPEQTWNDESLDALYRALRRHFEIEDRYRTLETKLSLVQANLLVIVDAMHQRRAAMLEVIVVLLIAFEIVLALFKR
ncbi:MAG: RMD1 family protein [Polyangiales bacterium]